MTGKFDWDKASGRKLVESHGAEPISNGSRTLSPKGYLRPNKKNTKKDPRPAIDVSPIVTRQENIEVARQAIVRDEADKQKRKHAASKADRDARKAIRAKKAKARALSDPPQPREALQASPVAVLQAMPRGKVRQVPVEVRSLSPSGQPPRRKT